MAHRPSGDQPAPRDESLLQGLTPAQRRAVVSDAQPLGILAGAGAGKTRVLTRRIAHRVASGTAEPQHVLALTFTRRAAGELSSRLKALGVRDRAAAGTFHAVAYAQLRRRWADRGERPPALLEHKARLLGPLLPPEADARDIAAEIEWAKARMVTPAGYEGAVAASGRRPTLPAATLASLYERYEDEKRRRAVVDFDDLVLLCAAALDTDRQFAATQRWRFRHLFVDEFQDLNPAQFRLLRGWLGDRPDLCAVGDPRQAIYGWNGADPDYLTSFARHFPGAATIALEENFRSSPQVVAVANAVADAASWGPSERGPQGPSGPSEREEQGPSGPSEREEQGPSGPSEREEQGSLRATRSDGPAPTVSSFATDRDEAEGIARALRRRRMGRPWSHLAVLTRTHAQLVLLEEALQAAAVPYRVRGGSAFGDRPEIRQAVAELGRGPAGRPLATAVADLREMACREAGAAERREHVEGLVRLATDQLAIDPTMSVEGFLGWLRAALREEGPGPAGATDVVELATLHAAKGLEWPVVFLAGLEEGFLPIAHADTPETRAEERRLFYVGVTRAEQELHCSWAKRRTFGGRALGRTASPYLTEVGAVVEALARDGKGADWRRYLDESRARLRALDGHPPRSGRPPAVPAGDQVVVRALTSWRATTARATGVPAFVILHDSTLAAVAAARPSDRGQLLAVPGMGPVKAERYGEALLGLVAGNSAH